MRDAVVPGGSRSRAVLCLTVAYACGDMNPRFADACAAAIELLHCASLVYDDLPSFDDAPVRRGQSAVHVVHGESTAILSAAALTVLAFEVLACAAIERPSLLAELLQVIACGAGCPSGIVAGQAWESEPNPDITIYHRAKTGALFESAVLAGAITGGGEPAQWVGLGHLIGEAYQIADDFRDAHSVVEELGKPVGQDSAHKRPSALTSLGAAGCIERIGALMSEACRRVPACANAEAVRAAIRQLESHLIPHSHRAAASPRTKACAMGE